MLRTRLITAVILLALTLLALLHTSAWAALMVLAVAAAGWEWGRMNGLGAAGRWATVAAVVLLATISARLGWVELGLASWGMGASLYAASVPTSALTPLWWAAALLWTLASVALLRGGVPTWQRLGIWPRWSGGVLALWAAWLAAVSAHTQGVGFLLSTMALVWMADVSAYFCGKSLGRHWLAKLAPSISPGKTWVGATGGMLGAMALALGWAYLEAKWLFPHSASVLENTHHVVQTGVFNFPHWGMSIFSVIFNQYGWGILILVVAWMTIMSIAGDLVESLAKRSAGLKDSSQLLPGHGGVLDRIDALLPTLPIAMIFVV